MSTTMAASHGVERTCWACKLSYRYSPLAKTFICEACAEPNEIVQLDGKWITRDPRPHIIEGKNVEHHTVSIEELGAPQPISLTEVLRTINQMSTENLRKLHDQLAIILLVDEANRYRSENQGSFATIARILGNAGVKM